MNIRLKDPARIREDALRVAARKLAGGCRPCADAYIDLARRNGASVEEIRQISPPSVQLGELTATSGFLGTSSMRRGVIRPMPEMRKVIDPFGGDSRTSPIAWFNGNELQFYIGRLGGGLTPDPSSSPLFNANSAVKVGPNFTYGYWNLQGPCNTPKQILNSSKTLDEAYHKWGIAQAAVAFQARKTGPFSSYIQGQTLFASVEIGNTGWNECSAATGTNKSYNQDVLNGFLDGITGAGLIPGVYINFSDGTISLFGSAYTPSTPFVFWTTGQICGLSICGPATGDCPPCTCDPAATVQSNWNIVQNGCWAGQGIAIWQFWITACKTSSGSSCPSGFDGDFNYSPQSANQQFTPMACTGQPCALLQDRSPGFTSGSPTFTYTWDTTRSLGPPNSYVTTSSCFPSGFANYWRILVSSTTGSGQTSNQYGFSIPSTATILGVQVTATFSPDGAHYHYDQGSCPPVDLDTPHAGALDSAEINLQANTGSNGGTSKPLIFGTNVYGGPNDLWGFPPDSTGLIPAVINSPNFGVGAGCCLSGFANEQWSPGFTDYVRTEHVDPTSDLLGNPPANIAPCNWNVLVTSVRVYYRV